LQSFIPQLKSHLLGCVMNLEYDGDKTDFTPLQRNDLQIVNNHIYLMQLFQVNYVTYNVKCDRDSLNPRIGCNVMVKSHEKNASHPFWYARVFGVFHTQVLHVGPNTINSSVQYMEFLWVRWYAKVTGHRLGFKVAQLPKIGFVDLGDKVSQFGFLDPLLVICSCNLIPAFHDEQTSALLRPGPSASHAPGESDD
ncbi:hypothetical protein SERLA73DRAFT_46988, partial [Serpula lacrymans var. lacrymans S7.3]